MKQIVTLNPLLHDPRSDVAHSVAVVVHWRLGVLDSLYKRATPVPPGMGS
jgi:hypothetical protein